MALHIICTYLTCLSSLIRFYSACFGPFLSCSFINFLVFYINISLSLKPAFHSFDILFFRANIFNLKLFSYFSFLLIAVSMVYFSLPPLLLYMSFYLKWFFCRWYRVEIFFPFFICYFIGGAWMWIHMYHNTDGEVAGQLLKFAPSIRQSLSLFLPPCILLVNCQ